MEGKLTRTGINLKLVMDQSVYVRKSIEALVQEGLLGAVLCSLVILMFLGEWRMTGIAIMTLPISCLASLHRPLLHGPHDQRDDPGRHDAGDRSAWSIAPSSVWRTHTGTWAWESLRDEAAFLGASEVAMPELVSTLCTFLVLSPLVLTPGLGEFLFQPMAMAVAFAMIAAYFLSRTLVPACSAFWLKPHASHGPADAAHGHGDGHPAPIQGTKKARRSRSMADSDGNGHAPRGNAIQRAFHRWEGMIDTGIAYYVKSLDFVLHNRLKVVGLSGSRCWPSPSASCGRSCAKSSSPKSTRAPSRCTYVLPAARESRRPSSASWPSRSSLRKVIDKEDLQLIHLRNRRHVGLVGGVHTQRRPDGRRGQGPALAPSGSKSAQEYVAELRREFAADSWFSDLEFAFDAGGMIRSAMNEGKSTADQHTCHRQEPANGPRRSPRRSGAKVVTIDGVVDARIIQRLDYPEYVIDVDRAKVGRARADPGRRHAERRRRAQLEHPVQQAEFLDRPGQQEPVLRRRAVPRKRHRVDRHPAGYSDHQPGAEPADPAAERRHDRADNSADRGDALQHPADDRADDGRRRARPGARLRRCCARSRRVRQAADGRQAGSPTIPPARRSRILVGTKIELSGEYLRMQDTFNSLGVGLCLAALLIYFLMVGAGPVVAGAAVGHADRPAVLDRRSCRCSTSPGRRSTCNRCWDSSSSSASRWPTRCS